MKQALLLLTFIGSFTLLAAQANTDYKFNGEQGVFTENQGQVVDQDGKPVAGVLAKASMPGLDMYLTKTGVTYVMLQYTEDLTAKPHPVFVNDKKFKVACGRVDVALAGAVITTEQMQLSGEAGWQTNYYKTADGNAQLAVPHFKIMTVQNVYPGIDWVWKFNAKGKLEYDFIVHPGADPATIKMQYSFTDLTQKGNSLVIGTRIGSMTEGPLQASSSNAKVKIAYNLDAKSKTVSFNATGYDKTKDLLIDPPLALNWSAEFGGSFLNGLRGVTTDNSGGVFLCGYTTSTDFPTYNPHINGSYIDSTFNGQSDAILLKLDTNQNLKWATYLGGPGNDFANGMCYNLFTGNIYVTGGAAAGFPLKLGVANHGGQDMFIASFNGALALTYSSMYGGTGDDEGMKICVNQSDVCYVVGYSNSSNITFPVINYSGGYNQSSVTGQEAFIMSFYNYGINDPFYTYWSTRFGGNGDDYATGVTTDTLNNTIVTGFTNSTNIPLAHADSSYNQTSNGGGYDGFILKFKPSSNALLNSTYYGGSGDDYFNDVATGANGSFEFTGRTQSSNFPLRNIGGYGYYQPHLADTSGDAFVVKCANNLTLKWATYYGGTSTDAGTGIATDKAGQMYVSGFTFSHNFPVDSAFGAFYQPVNHGNSDGFIARFTDLGYRNWSTYKGDSCYQYPYDITYNTTFNKFYVVGQGLLACGEGFVDTGQVHNGVSSVGFAWAFNGQTTPPCTGFGLGVRYDAQPCPGQCNGIATASAAGGHAPYHFIWSNGLTTLTDSSLCPQESWVEVEDSLGCFAEAQLYFSPVTVTQSTTSIVCNPGPGSVTATASNGNPGQDIYQWSTSPGVWSDSTVILVSDTGQYTVTVQDSRGCTVTSGVEVVYNNVYPNGQPEIIQYPSCGNLGDGVVTLDFQGTDSIFPMGNVIWEDGNGDVLATGDTFYNASTLQQYYAVDSGYCYNGVTSPYFFSVYLYNSTDLALLVPYVGPSTCLNLGGQASVQFEEQSFNINGTPPNNNIFYGNNMNVDNYPNDILQWSDGEQGQAAVSLGIGAYYVTITDNTCTTVLNGYFNAPSGPQVSPLIDSAYCNGGEIDLSNTYGGQGGPYTYQWPDGGINYAEIGLFAGNYVITITDAGGCADTVTYFVPQGTPLGINLVGSDALCFGGTGIVTVSGSAGVPPYQGAGTFNEPAGNYTYTITDNQGCTASGGLAINQPAVVVVTATLVSPVFCSNSTATYNVTATGGTAPYSGTGTQYEPIGTDVVTVTDANGCTGSTTIVVAGQANGNPIIYSNNYTPIVCHGDSTTVTITATGGHPPYTGTGVYVKRAGTYYITISDSFGCSIIDTLRILQPTQLQVTLHETGITCSPGAVTAVTTGGSPLYMFQWSTSPGFSDSSVIYVGQSGIYSVTAQDENFCTATDSVFVDYNNSTPTIDSVIILQYPACGLNNGIVYIQATDPTKITWTLPNGTFAYGDTLYNAPISTNFNINNILITDSSFCINGVSAPVQYQLSILPHLANHTFGFDTALAIPYNPTGCNTKDGSINNTLTNWASLYVNVNNQGWTQYTDYTNPNGMEVVIPSPVIYQWSTGVTDTIITNWVNNEYYQNGNGLVNLNAGTYTVTVTNGTCQVIDTVILTTTVPPLITTYTIISPVCNGERNGSIKLTGESNNYPNAFGDTTNAFRWSNGDSTSSIAHLSSGVYSVTITGPNACPVIDTFNLTAPQAVVIHDSIVPSLCANGGATITITATGGISPYTGTGVFIKAPGNYILTVTDSNGCTASDSITVAPSLGHNQLLVTSTATPILCNGLSSTVSISASGGIAPYTGTGTYTKPAGDYVFVVTDSAGCSTADTVNITQPGILFITQVINPVPCYGGNATITLSGRGGTAPYTGTGVFSKPAGNYVFVIADANGCSSNDSISITQPAPLTLTDTFSRINCFGGNSTVILSASGGTPPYYGTGTLLQPAGNDVLIVSDQNGCSDSVSLNITQPAPVVIHLQLQDSLVHCADTVRATITASGGNGTYTGTGSITYTQSGTYTINVSDGNGCLVDTVVHIHLDTCTGVETIADNGGIMVYPNPASDKFYVKFLIALDESTDLRLFAVDGKLVMVKTIDAGTNLTEMDCNQLASGVYILRATVLNKEYNFKVVVTK